MAAAALLKFTFNGHNPVIIAYIAQNLAQRLKATSQKQVYL